MCGQRLWGTVPQGPPQPGSWTHVSQNSTPGLPEAGVLTRVSQNSAPGPPAVPLEPALWSHWLQQTNSLVLAVTTLLQRVSRWKVKLKNQIFRDLTAGHTFWSRNEGSGKNFLCVQIQVDSPAKVTFLLHHHPRPTAGQAQPRTLGGRSSPLLHP